MSQLVMAVYDDRDQALAAVDALVSEGVDPSAIGFLAGRPERFGQLHNPGVVESSDQATAIRAGKGPFASPPGTMPGAAGSSTPGYALRDLTEFDVPGFGMLLAAGPLTPALQASPAWPAEHAIPDALIRRGIDTSQARIVHEELRRGGILLTIHDRHADRWQWVLERYRPVDLQA